MIPWNDVAHLATPEEAAEAKTRWSEWPDERRRAWIAERTPTQSLQLTITANSYDDIKTLFRVWRLLLGNPNFKQVPKEPEYLITPLGVIRLEIVPKVW